MRGRHNHGKRQALFNKRRLRYMRRRFRFDRSGRKSVARHGFVPFPGQRKPKWVMSNYPRKQRRLRYYLNTTMPWPMLPTTFPVVVYHPSKGRKHPPRWFTIPPLGHHSPGHGTNDRRVYIGKQRRVVMALGHKVGRLRGHAWFSAAARRYWYSNGGLGWPSWDPDHRMPIWP